MKSVKVTNWGDKIKARTFLMRYYSTNVELIHITLDRTTWTSPPLQNDNAEAFCDGINLAGGNATLIN